ncbi:MAG: ribulose-5-phosphate 4-epimerase/fuculose-1-phosphate aldolase [Alphaproteobacteria bacterium]|jgi:ribulose-5-phosphate 4-epimerase/fuculose-1-phosphate aldolase
MTADMTLEETRRELTLANHILAKEGLLVGLGHISTRHPDDPERFILARALAPNLVGVGDLHEFDLGGNLVDGSDIQAYGERVIHAAVYAARPDITSICHCHPIELIPFCNIGIPPKPVTHVGGMMGTTIPVWDNRDDFGDTQIIVVKMDEAQSMAKALGPHRVCLLRRHGAVVVGKGIRETVFRSIVLRDNAKVHLDTLKLGEPTVLHPKEMELSNTLHESPRILERIWGGLVADLGADIDAKLK